jgi:hypothetical protein
MDFELCELRPTGLEENPTHEAVTLSVHQHLEGAWYALITEQRRFHEQLRDNGEGASRATIHHRIVDSAGVVLVGADYRPGDARQPYVPMDPPWVPLD